MSLETMAAPDTLSRSLQPSSIDLSRLGREYRPLLQLVRLVIGVVPNCDSLLAIWPPGFRSYNLRVPNLLNVPFSVWGWGPPVVPLGLALYTASWTARCSYCTAHTCAFTLRRGAPPATLTGSRSPAESAAVAAAEALASIPCTFTRQHREDLRRHFSARDAEGIALGVALMGFLNKFMDAAGVDLEAASVKEVSPVLLPTGWTTGKHRVAAEASADPALQPRPGGRDTLATKLAFLRYVPAAPRAKSRGGPGASPGESGLPEPGHGAGGAPRRSRRGPLPRGPDRARRLGVDPADAPPAGMLPRRVTAGPGRDCAPAPRLKTEP